MVKREMQKIIFAGKNWPQEIITALSSITCPRDWDVILDRTDQVTIFSATQKGLSRL